MSAQSTDRLGVVQLRTTGVFIDLDDLSRHMAAGGAARTYAARVGASTFTIGKICKKYKIPTHVWQAAPPHSPRLRLGRCVH